MVLHLITFSNMSFKFFHAVYVVVTQVWATVRAAALSCALEELYQPATRNHCKGAQTLGKSHCCEDCCKDVGMPPGYPRTFWYWSALSTNSCLVTFRGEHPHSNVTREDR